MGIAEGSISRARDSLSATRGSFWCMKLAAGFFALVLYRMLPEAADAGEGYGRDAQQRVFHITGEPSFSLPDSPPGLVAAFVISQYGHGPAAPLRFAIVVAVVLPTVTLLSWITCKLIEIPRRRAASSSGALGGPALESVKRSA